MSSQGEDLSTSCSQLVTDLIPCLHAVCAYCCATETLFRSESRNAHIRPLWCFNEITQKSFRVYCICFLLFRNHPGGPTIFARQPQQEYLTINPTACIHLPDDATLFLKKTKTKHSLHHSKMHLQLLQPYKVFLLRWSPFILAQEPEVCLK